MQQYTAGQRDRRGVGFVVILWREEISSRVIFPCRDFQRVLRLPAVMGSGMKAPMIGPTMSPIENMAMMKATDAARC